MKPETGGREEAGKAIQGERHPGLSEPPAGIRAHSPALADHLDATIHTGSFCSYSPDPRAPITWRP